MKNTHNSEISGEALKMVSRIYDSEPIQEDSWMECARFRAENAELREALEYLRSGTDEPEYHAQGMGCGIEDRDIMDRYDAAEYGWDAAVERYQEWIRNAVNDALSGSGEHKRSNKMREPTHRGDCQKIVHSGSGYLHADDDDSPYDVDGVTYCGRCHRAIDVLPEVENTESFDQELTSSPAGGGGPR